MSTDLVPLGDIERMAAAIAKSGLFGLKTPDQALAMMLIAQANGQHPATAARDYNIIGNTPAKKSEAMLRDFLAAGGKVEWREYSDERCDAVFSHPQGGTVRVDWDMLRAKKAGLGGKDNYQKYTRNMFRARCISEGVRTVCPAASSGLYTPEEVAEFRRRETHLGMADEVDPATGEITQPEPSKPAARATILTPAPPAPTPAPQPLAEDIVQRWIEVIGLQGNEIMLNTKRDDAMRECQSRGDRAAAEHIAAAVKARRAELQAKAAAGAEKPATGPQAAPAGTSGDWAAEALKEEGQAA